jgi:isopropylmalate/isohomocitrate dehydrogenase-like protein
MKIAIISGDGIGPEIMEAALQVLSHCDFDPEYIELKVGYQRWKRDGVAISKDDFDTLKECKAVLKGPITTPPRMKDSFPSVTLQIRKELGLYANVRPLKSLPISPCKNVDMVIVRENTEGLYSGVETFDGEIATTQRIITRTASKRIINFAFNYAKKNARKKVTCVHKANVMKKTCGIFKEIFYQEAKRHSDISVDEILIDACTYKMVTDPQKFDVIVTTNMFGDILSDLAASFIGSLGLIGSSNIGDKHYLFEPIHGTAPDIAGKNIANPIGMLKAASYMLDTLGRKEGNNIRKSITQILERKLSLTPDLGGTSTTSEFTKAIISQYSPI